MTSTAVADLQAASGGVEGDHSGDHRGQRPRADQAQQRSWRRFGDVLDRDRRDPEQCASGCTEEASLGTGPQVTASGDPHERGTKRKDRGLDGDQRRQRGVSLAPAPVNPMTTVLPR